MASVNVGGRWHLWAWWILLLSMWAVFLFWAISFWWMNYALDDGKEFAKMYDPTMTKFKTDWFYGQEADLIFFALPTLFIAILGALYLSLPKTPNTARWPLGKFWSLLTTTPIVLPRPLGIIKVGELLSYLVFLALIAWGLWQWIVWGRNDVEKQYKAGEITTYKQKWQMELDHHSVTIAWVSFFPFYFLFYPITRRSILLQLMGVQYEQAVKYHRWLGYATILLGSVHSLLFWLLWIIQGKFEKAFEWAYDGISNLAGGILFIIGLVILVTSIGPVRRRYFEVFFYTHHLYLLFLVFYLLHAGVWPLVYAIVPITLFFLDRLLRFAQSRREISVANLQVLPSGYISFELPSTADIKYPSSSVVFLNIPAISQLEWHAFSVASTSATSPDSIHLLVKPSGTWTEGIAHLPLDDVKARVEGLYFPARSTILTRYDAIVLVGGGSGIVPFLSLIRDLLQAHGEASDDDQLPSHVVLIWVVRHSEELSILDTLQPSSINPNYQSTLTIKTLLYVTKEDEESRLAPTGLDLVPKDPKQALSHSPPRGVYVPILPRIGGKSWLAELFLVVVVTFGTILTMAFFYRAIVYSFEHTGPAPTEQKEEGEHSHHHAEGRRQMSFHGKVLISLLSHWLGILISTAVAVCTLSLFGTTLSDLVFGSKDKDNSRSEGFSEEKQPLQFATSLRESATVHFGGRPDWKNTIDEVLLKMGQFNHVGLFVSGPPSMQRSLAWECQKRSIFAKRAPPHLSYQEFSFEF